MLDWIKKNWKTIALLGIPVLISWVISLIRQNQSLENKVEMKDKELDIEREVDELGDKLVEKANETNSLNNVREICSSWARFTIEKLDKLSRNPAFKILTELTNHLVSYRKY